MTGKEPHCTIQCAFPLRLCDRTIAYPPLSPIVLDIYTVVEIYALLDHLCIVLGLTTWSTLTSVAFDQNTNFEEQGLIKSLVSPPY